jgi:hypothetical protein
MSGLAASYFSDGTSQSGLTLLRRNIEAFPLHGGRLDGGVAPEPGREARLGAGADQRFVHYLLCEHPQPCPSPMEGEGFAMPAVPLGNEVRAT